MRNGPMRDDPMRDDPMWQRLQGTGREVMWQRLNGTGLEHLRLGTTSERVVADGSLLGIEGDKPFRASYTVECDGAWRIRRARITLADGTERHLGLRAGADGALELDPGQTDGGLTNVPAVSFEGSLDLDIYPSPFTNTLAIRRLRLALGESAEITVAFVTLPELTVAPVRQRYTCLAADAFGGRYRYESLESGFQTELAVDSARLVVEYPGWFRRVWP